MTQTKRPLAALTPKYDTNNNVSWLLKYRKNCQVGHMFDIIDTKIIVLSFTHSFVIKRLMAAATTIS